MRTSLPLDVNGTAVEGAVYQAVGRPQVFYVTHGDAMLTIGKRQPASSSFVNALESSPTRKALSAQADT